VRFEARTQERLDRIQATFLEPLRRLGVGEPVAH